MDTQPQRGPLPGEMMIPDLMRMLGLGRTRTWQLVVLKNEIPYRRDARGYIYIRRADAEGYVRQVRRGRPPASEQSC